MTLQKLRWGVLICGVALLAVTAVGAARGWKSGGLEIIAPVGVVCLLLALIGDKIREIVFKYGKASVQLKLNDVVESEVKVTGLAGMAGIYSFVHNQLGNDPVSYDVKVRLQDELVATVKENAFDRPVDAAEVDKVLTSGSAAERVLVFGLLQADRDLATVARLEQGISKSKSGNEQYHALLATQAHWGAFPKAEKEQLRGYIEKAPYINADKDRRELAQQILAS